MHPFQKHLARFAAPAAGLAVLASNVPLALAAPTFNSTGNALPVQGQTFSTPSGNNGGTAYIATVATNILDVILLLLGIVAVFYIILYGFQYLTAGGDPEKVKKARSGIINAVIGVIIIISAFAIVQLGISASGIVSSSTNSTTTNNNPFGGGGG
jgi:cytochrome bd-type quinol oxidase subunit 2